MNRIVWTQEMRRKMYSRIVAEIGRHQDWDEKIRPRKNRQSYEQLLRELAEEFSGEATALQQQINFATTTQAQLSNQSHIRSYILNKAAALEAGFIVTNELSNHLTSD